ncbi:MAG: transglutaminase family protein, partial [Opitutaceae bacterium]
AGTLTIFIPPLLLASYVALLVAIEETLAELKLHDVVLAGYAPPADPALPTVGLASDPGVLEINVSPCATWLEYDRQLEQLYAAAKTCGLCARKVQFNGREVGTGGGAHLVFGGPAGLLSPFFAFPALLPSIIRYWQHHPALSYAFTGAYMGPSSQAPRIDESTFEALYELEIACTGAETLGSPQNLALFDLLFRDLLMDRSGNTHRAEISVDKLWNPFAPNGRLGLVEFRAFETHPLRSVQSVTALFVRAILARLCAAPFRSPFVRWAGELHDKFFLPAFVWENLAAICADLKAHGIAFDPEWLRAPWEFRFPKLGEFALKFQKPLPPDAPTDKKAEEESFAIEFRQALEAWPLLGESPNAGTVARTVDSSLDRIEARISDQKFLEGGLLLVNGLPCEFRTIAASGSQLSTLSSQPAAAATGIRYRAFYLSPSLQPHVPVHAPLLIEWVERATLVVVAAARWHVWNPRYASYDTAPADDTAAAARRAERWEPWPHTIGQPRFVPRIDFPPEGKHTLDLRRYPTQAR